ncbi:MAG TPA: hypothetical protein VL242_27695 [Sorangium sp.]|nr:hypothetical protein [Sorangium sp.]
MTRFAVAWLLLVVLLAACHRGDGALQDDGFRRRLARGCGSEPDCLVLELEAQARVDRCASTCEEAEADLRASRSLVAPHRQQREARQAQIAAQRQALEAAEAERRRAELEAAEEARRQDEAAHAASLELAAAELACAQQGDAAACDALLRYLAGADAMDARDERAAQVRASHEKGRRLIAERGAARERSREAAETPTSARPGGRSGARPGQRPAPEGRVCCCDGTLSPTCTYVKRGCCSHHGGVCACP